MSAATKPAWTPGPWTYGVRTDGSVWISFGEPLGPGGHYQFDWHASEADARIAVAAPDLYEIGAELLAIFQHPTQSVTVLETEKLRAALARARCEQP